jgi:hypothetical protein
MLQLTRSTWAGLASACRSASFIMRMEACASARVIARSVPVRSAGHCSRLIEIAGVRLYRLKLGDVVINLLNRDLTRVVLVEHLENRLVLSLVYGEVIRCHYQVITAISLLLLVIILYYYSSVI